MEISKKDLLKAMNIAVSGIDNGNTILEGSDTFTFKDKNLYSFNNTIGIKIPLFFLSEDCVLEGSVKAKDFLDLISRFSTDTINIIMKENKWIIKNESARAEIVLQNSSILDYMKKIQLDHIEWSKIPEQFFNAINVCYINSNKSDLSGIFINENKVISTDEIRINLFELDSKMNGQFWINDNSIKELSKLNEEIEYYFIDDTWIHFKGKNEIIFSCKRLQDSLYPYNKILEIIEKNKIQKNDIKGELPKDLLKAINRASVLSMNIESFNSIEITFKKDKITVFSQRTIGNYKEDIKWISPIEEDREIKILIDYKYFSQGIVNSDGFYLKDGEGVTKIIFTHANGLQIVNTFEGNE